MAVWQQGMPQFPATTATEQQIKSWLIQLNQALEYAFHNIDGGNMVPAARAVVEGGGSAAKEVPLSAEAQEKLNALRRQLRGEILANAQTMAHDAQVLVEQMSNALRSEVSEGYIARSEDVEAGTSAELMQLVDSAITQTSTAWQAQFSTLEQATQQVGDEFDQYVALTETYIRLSKLGIEIGMLENNEQAPYSVLLGNEKLSFKQYGAEVAYFQYNKLYVTSAEFLDRFSVGSAANGGFFEFVTNPQGLGIKWRDA